MRVFKLVTKGTIEEHIKSVADDKTKLIGQTVDKCVDLDEQKIESENLVKQNWRKFLSKIE